MMNNKTHNNTQEIWREIIGFSGKYFVSNFGNVKSLFGKEEKILKQFISNTGYNLVVLVKNGKKILCKVHRIVASAFIDNPLSKPQVNHKDGVKTNNNVNNLEWVTAAENMKHAVAMGLIKKNKDTPKITGKIKVFDENGVYVATFDASRDVIKYLKEAGYKKANPGHILEVLNGKRRSAYNHKYKLQE